MEDFIQALKYFGITIKLKQALALSHFDLFSLQISDQIYFL